MMRAFQNQTAGLKRGLGLLLLIFIFYGTTVEAAHRHGRVVPPSNPAASSFDKTGTTSTTPTTQGCSDCLICQLHQNFSATLITVKPFTESLDVYPAISACFDSLDHSQSSIRSSTTASQLEPPTSCGGFTVRRDMRNEAEPNLQRRSLRYVRITYREYSRRLMQCFEFHLRLQ